MRNLLFVSDPNRYLEYGETSSDSSWVDREITFSEYSKVQSLEGKLFKPTLRANSGHLVHVYEWVILDDYLSPFADFC